MEMTITLGENQKVDAESNGFTVRTDQSKEEGGDGSAPAPFTLFLASIGTCAGYYVQAFCRSRDLSTDGVRIVQEYDWDKENKRVTEIKLTVHVPADFPEKYHKALVRAADQCTVKRALFAPPEFVMGTVVDR